MSKYNKIFILITTLILIGTIFTVINIVLLEGNVNKMKKEITNLRLKIENKSVIEADVTGYSAHEDETNSNPQENAAGTRPVIWSAAVSCDLFNKGWTYGKYIYVEQIGRFKIMDRMNCRFEKRVDIFFLSKKAAFKFGITRKVKVALLEI